MVRYYGVWAVSSQELPVAIFSCEESEAQEKFEYIKTLYTSELEIMEISQKDFQNYDEIQKENAEQLDEDVEKSKPGSSSSGSLYFAIWKLNESSEFPIALFVSDTKENAVVTFNNYRAGETWYKLTQITRKDYLTYFKYVYSKQDIRTVREAEKSRNKKADHPNILFSVKDIRNFFEKYTKARHMIEIDYNQSIESLNKDEMILWLACHYTYYVPFLAENDLPDFRERSTKKKSEDELKEDINKCKNMYDILSKGLKDKISTEAPEKIIKDIFLVFGGECDCKEYGECYSYKGIIGDVEFSDSFNKSDFVPKLSELVKELLINYGKNFGIEDVNIENIFDTATLTESLSEGNGIYFVSDSCKKFITSDIKNISLFTPYEKDIYEDVSAYFLLIYNGNQYNFATKSSLKKFIDAQDINTSINI